MSLTVAATSALSGSAMIRVTCPSSASRAGEPSGRISTTTAPTRPLAMPQNVHTISVATASEAGTRRNASWIE